MQGSRISLITLLIIMVCIPRFAIDFYLPSMPSIQSYFQTTTSAVQLTLTLYTMGLGLSVLVFGFLADYFCKKHVLMLGSIGLCLVGFLCYYAWSIEVLILARFLQGVFAGCGTAIARAMIRNDFDYREQVIILSYLSTAVNFAPSVGLLGGGWLGSTLGWQSNFALINMIVLLKVLLTYRILPPCSTYPTGPKQYKILEIVRTVSLNPVFAILSIQTGFVLVIEFVFLYNLPFLLKDFYSLDQVEVGGISTVCILGIVIGTLIARNLNIKFSTFRIFSLNNLTLLLISIFGFFTSWEVENLWGFALWCLACTVCVGVSLPTAHIAILRPFPHFPGSAFGLFFSATMVLNSGGGIVLAKLNTRSPYEIVFLCLLLSVVLNFLYLGIYGIFRRRLKAVMEAANSS